MQCCRIVNGIKNKKHKKQPWGAAKCEAFHFAPRLFFMFLFQSPAFFPLNPYICVMMTVTRQKDNAVKPWVGRLRRIVGR